MEQPADDEDSDGGDSDDDDGDEDASSLSSEDSDVEVVRVSLAVFSATVSWFSPVFFDCVAHGADQSSLVQ